MFSPGDFKMLNKEDRSKPAFQLSDFFLIFFFFFFLLILSLQSQKAESYHTASKYEGTHWFMWNLLP